MGICASARQALSGRLSLQILSQPLTVWSATELNATPVVRPSVVLTPPIRFTLEQAMEFIDDDELIEVTPTSIRLRKRNLREVDRKRSERVTAEQS